MLDEDGFGGVTVGVVFGAEGFADNGLDDDVPDDDVFDGDGFDGGWFVDDAFDVDPAADELGFDAFAAGGLGVVGFAGAGFGVGDGGSNSLTVLSLVADFDLSDGAWVGAAVTGGGVQLGASSGIKGAVAGAGPESSARRIPPNGAKRASNRLPARAQRRARDDRTVDGSTGKKSIEVGPAFSRRAANYVAARQFTKRRHEGEMEIWAGREPADCAHRLNRESASGSRIGQGGEWEGLERGVQILRTADSVKIARLPQRLRLRSPMSKQTLCFQGFLVGTGFFAGPAGAQLSETAITSRAASPSASPAPRAADTRSRGFPVAATPATGASPASTDPLVDGRPRHRDSAWQRVLRR